MKNSNRSEKGQALVLIVLSVVALFGFTALAVDVGRVYAERRRAQNAADSAVLAAAYHAVDTADDPYTIAYTNALLNGFDNDGVTNTVTVNNPPVGGPYDGDPDYYQVIIWQHVDPIFAQFIFAGAQEITNEAVARAVPTFTVSSGNAVHSLSEECGGGQNNNSMTLDGTTGVNVDGGNMFANGCWKKAGSSGKVRITDTGLDGTVATRPGGIQVAGPDWDCTGCSINDTSDATVWPDIMDSSDGIVEQSVPDLAIKPYCPTSDTTIDGVDYYIHPHGIQGGKKDYLLLGPGIHCVDGDIDGMVKGDHVLIYLRSGDITQTGGDALDLRAAHDMKDANGTQWGGMVIYAPSSNTGELKWGGNTSAYIQGTIFAPGATCLMGGNMDGKNYRSAVICNKVGIHGNPTVKIIYRQEELFHFPPIVELSQ